ncbi:MAG TPA: flavin reductase family protein [Firmicutes bacterium]|nr:flavin reductase family protein [Bacillota bacterium]
MERKPIPVYDFTARPYHLFDRQWLLLTSGDFHKNHFNAMTISWGAIGFIWDRPLLIAVVRPTRYTYEFANHYDTFTVCAFPESCRDALNLLGTKSGRDGDKIAESGLTPVASQVVAAPSFAEADLVVECRKVYWQDLDPSHFLDPSIEEFYPHKDYHRAYFGEVVGIFKA